MFKSPERLVLGSGEVWTVLQASEGHYVHQVWRGRSLCGEVGDWSLPHLYRASLLEWLR